MICESTLTGCENPQRLSLRSMAGSSVCAERDLVNRDKVVFNFSRRHHTTSPVFDGVFAGVHYGQSGVNAVYHDKQVRFLKEKKTNSPMAF